MNNLRNEILGRRADEFSIRCMLVRFLADKARGLAMLKAQQAGLMTDECFVPLDMNSVRDLDGQQRVAYVNHNILKATNHLPDLKEQWIREQPRYRENAEAWYDSRAYRKGVREAYSGGFGKAQGPLFAHSDVTERLYQSFSGDAGQTAVAEGVTHADYVKLNVTQFQLCCDYDHTIGEPILRSIHGMDHMKALSTLARDEYVAMLRNLAAGSDIEDSLSTEIIRAAHGEEIETRVAERQRREGPEASTRNQIAVTRTAVIHEKRLELLAGRTEEVESARQRNREGLRTFKQVPIRQYDYLERKYGDCLQQLSPEEQLEKLPEMQADFSTLQVDSNMLSRLDELLKKGCYYCGNIFFAVKVFCQTLIIQRDPIARLRHALFEAPNFDAGQVPFIERLLERLRANPAAPVEPNWDERI